MEPKMIIINLIKVIVATFCTLLLINFIGVVFQYFNITKSGVDISSFEYKHGQFSLNGQETYNQFGLKYLVFNILLFLVFFCFYFQDLFKVLSK